MNFPYPYVPSGKHPLRIGFTGTRDGMTRHQMNQVRNFFISLDIKCSDLEIHHGDCVGADAEFHYLTEVYWSNIKPLNIVVHPPVIETYRAFMGSDRSIDVLDPDEYLSRNRTIVDSSDFMIATPKEQERQRSGGTWYTIKYAETNNKPLYIINP